MRDPIIGMGIDVSSTLPRNTRLRVDEGNNSPVDSVRLGQRLLEGDPRPIGVFDSGVGGLTVLKAVRERLPNESTTYLGDIAHFPYGERPQAEITRFSAEIIRYLESCNCKMVVIACNTATAAALEMARDCFSIPVIGVIAPTAQAAVMASDTHRVAVISTEATARSGKYPAEIHRIDRDAQVVQQACPDLVRIVETGNADTPMAERAIRKNLDVLVNSKQGAADVLVLACTHFPLLKATIERVFPSAFKLVDSADATVDAVERQLDDSEMRAGPAAMPRHEILVTGNPTGFQRIADSLLGNDSVTAKRVKLPST